MTHQVWDEEIRDCVSCPRNPQRNGKSGEIAWIVDLVGAPVGIAKAVEWLKAGPFKEREAVLISRDRSGPRVVTLDEFAVNGRGVIT
jgi:hypothetical protein